MQQSNLNPVDVLVPFNLASGLVKATATLTSNNTNASTGKKVVVGTKEYTFIATALTAAVAATGVLTSDNTNVTEGDTVTIGTQVYKFIAIATGLTPALGGPRSYTKNEVLMGTTADLTMANLIHAINGTGVAGVNYSLGTKLNPDVSAGTLSAHAFTVTARVTGTVGNAIAKAEASTHLDWDGTGAVLTGGVDTVPNQVLIGASADATLQNLVDAINGTVAEGTKGPGVNYGVGTVANADVDAADVGSHASVMTAKVGGIVGNAIAKSTDETTLDWDGAGAVFTGGGSTKGKYTIRKGGGFAHRFITIIPALTGTPTTAVSLYDANDVLMKALVATQAESNTTDTAYEVELAPGDYILFTASATVSDAEQIRLIIR